MRSHLTRRIFRQILKNQLLSHSHDRQHVRSHVLQHSILPTNAVVSRRHFMWFSSPNSRKKVKEAQMDPGIAQLQELALLLRMDVRPPPLTKIISSLRDFFTFKLRNRTLILDSQMEAALTAFKHVMNYSGQDSNMELSEKDLIQFLKVVRQFKKTDMENTSAELAGLIYQELVRRGYRPSESVLPRSESDTSVENEPLYLYLRALRTCGLGRQIRTMLEEGLQTEGAIFTSIDLWLQGLMAFAKEGNHEEFGQLLLLMDRNGVSLDKERYEVILLQVARQGEFETLRKIFLTNISRYGKLNSKANAAIVDRCMAHSDLELGQSIINQILDSSPSKSEWDSVLQWATFKEKDVKAIEPMIEIMAKDMAQRGLADRPDTSTVNKLLEIAYLISSPSIAEGFVSLAAKRGIPLDGNSYMLQMKHRLENGDIPGSQLAFKEAQAFELPLDMVTLLVNGLIQKLCIVESPNHDLVMDYVDELIARKADFLPSTVASLIKLHLQRDEYHDALDLLQTHSWHFDRDQRSTLQEMLTKYILNRAYDTSRAWDAYTLLRKIFSETDLAVRTKIMNEFFARGKPEMGLHVFGHMRQAELSERRPTSETYVQCLEGLSKFDDEESIELVHNMLKLDAEVEPDTRTRNALMLAYLACGRCDLALRFWDDIAHSREGPTYNSICIAFRACEISAWGDKYAEDIWRKLQKFGVEPTSQLYASYIGALSGLDLVEEAIEAVSNMSKVVGTEPDVFTLGTLYNASRSPQKRQQITAWILSSYPAIWEELKGVGKTEVFDMELSNFNIDRSLSA